MPFTPIHMGPGIAIKAIAQGSFSLMIFGWTQIVMDVQPLIAIITGHGKLHGFTHTYVGAALVAAVAALSGKRLSEWSLGVIHGKRGTLIPISWPVTIISAIIGAASHVVLDSIMHADMEPLFPFSAANDLLGTLSIAELHRLCFYAGIAGGAGYFAVQWVVGRSAES